MKKSKMMMSVLMLSTSVLLLAACSNSAKSASSSSSSSSKTSQSSSSTSKSSSSLTSKASSSSTQPSVVSDGTCNTPNNAGIDKTLIINKITSLGYVEAFTDNYGNPPDWEPGKYCLSPENSACDCEINLGENPDLYTYIYHITDVDAFIGQFSEDSPNIQLTNGDWVMESGHTDGTAPVWTILTNVNQIPPITPN